MECGFVGLGSMGGAIAERLARSGVRLHVCDLNLSAAARFAGFGARVYGTPAEVGDAAEIVCTCLPTVEASMQAMLGDAGISGGGRVRYVVEMSTIGTLAMTELAMRLAERGIATLDAPVSGGVSGARDGTLAIMIAGAPDVRAFVATLLSSISSRMLVVSDKPGDAQSMKLVNNLLAAANMATAFEALTLATRLGLNAEKVVEVVNLSSGRNSGFDARKADAILTERFDVGGKIALLDKDIALAFDEARRAGFPVAVLSALTGMAQLWQRAMAAGMGEDDVSTLIKLIKKESAEPSGG